MNKRKEGLMIKADLCYQSAEEKAAGYFQKLLTEVIGKTYVSTLTNDIQAWNHHHMQHPLLSLFSRRKKESSTKEYRTYLRLLEHTGKLDDYLERSVSYLFMRDLGKSLDSPDSQQKINQAVEWLKNHLVRSMTSEHSTQTQWFSIAGFYRWAQKEGIESAFMWLISKLRMVSSHIPAEMDADHAKRKLIKIIAGVLMHVMEDMHEGTPPAERRIKLDRALRLGYSYGLTYPFIDDLLDSSVLSLKEKEKYSNFIRTALVTGKVPELGIWTGENKDLIRFIHSELSEAFECMKGNQRPESLKTFFEQSFVFYQSQEIDRMKKLSNPHYTNEELYIPIILKSSSSRLIVRNVLAAPKDEGFHNRTFYYGIYNQLADDFADMFGDMEEEAVTPFTYYMKYHESRPDLINPFELYWTVIVHLIHNVYQSDTKTREIILNRAINGLRRFKVKVGPKKYKDVMELFASGSPKFNRMIQSLVKKAENVDFFDKLLRDLMITQLKNDRKEQEAFFDTIKTVKSEINDMLPITETENRFLMEEPIIDAANYSLQGDGKRLRPIITWMMGVNVYGLKPSAIKPHLRSLEYMHTASLIFDDLPSQDNADIRRGRPTLHQVYNSAISELTGLFLTQKAVEEQASLMEFDPKTVLRLIQYSADITKVMCQGQAMDIGSKGKSLSIEQLNQMCFYKTGIAFEACLMMPAILAQADESEMKTLKKFALHAGIAFQIKDDLLDVEGDQTLLGKTVGKDAENNKTTFVSALGNEGAAKEMWEHYSLAIETLQKLQRPNEFLKHLINYMVFRDR